MRMRSLNTQGKQIRTHSTSTQSKPGGTLVLPPVINWARRCCCCCGKKLLMPLLPVGPPSPLQSLPDSQTPLHRNSKLTTACPVPQRQPPDPWHWTGSGTRSVANPEPQSARSNKRIDSDGLCYQRHYPNCTATDAVPYRNCTRDQRPATSTETARQTTCGVTADQERTRGINRGTTHHGRCCRSWIGTLAVILSSITIMLIAGSSSVLATGKILLVLVPVPPAFVLPVAVFPPGPLIVALPMAMPTRLPVMVTVPPAHCHCCR
jgi:hypothetical protein